MFSDFSCIGGIQVIKYWYLKVIQYGQVSWDYVILLHPLPRNVSFSILWTEPHTPLTPVYSLHRINTLSRWQGVKLWLVASKRVSENNGPRTWRFLPPAICLQLFISSACVLQRRAPARRPICACRSGGGEEVTALPSARLSPCTEGKKKKTGTSEIR